MEKPVHHPKFAPDHLIETMKYCPLSGLHNLDLHLDRLCRSARDLGFSYNLSYLRSMLAENANGDRALRIRLTLPASGFASITCSKFKQTRKIWGASLHATPLNSNWSWLRYKSNMRTFYDNARRSLPDGRDEWLFVNERGALTEGTITNIFVETSQGCLVTPPLGDGLLPGVLRQTLINSKKCKVARLTPEDLKNVPRFFIGNSLRGLIEAKLMTNPNENRPTQPQKP